MRLLRPTRNSSGDAPEATKALYVRDVVCAAPAEVARGEGWGDASPSCHPRAPCLRRRRSRL
eukprot:10498086-Alexandrium_andersonii.AAC.1